jgi:hypothetical protein
MARRVLSRNLQHRGLQLALSEVDALLRDAAERHDAGAILAPDYVLWSGLAKANATPMDILTMVCASILYEQLGGDSARDRQAYVHRVARAVLSLDRLRPNRKDLAATGQRLLGTFLLDRYAPLALGVVDAVKVGEQRDRERQALLTSPMR